MAAATATTRKVVTVVASDVNDDIRQFITDNHQPRYLYATAIGRRRHPHSMHVYVAGPPCQSFAAGGKGLAERDPRAGVLVACIDNITAELPRVAIIEN